MSDQYHIYTITMSGATHEIAVPEQNVEAFEAHLDEFPEGHIEDVLNAFGVFLVG